jgi:hypothetical protein
MPPRTMRAIQWVTTALSASRLLLEASEPCNVRVWSPRSPIAASLLRKAASPVSWVRLCWATALKSLFSSALAWTVGGAARWEAAASNAVIEKLVARWPDASTYDLSPQLGRAASGSCAVARRLAEQIESRAVERWTQRWEMWASIRDDLQEIVWLMSVVTALSLAGVGIAVMLVAT